MPKINSLKFYSNAIKKHEISAKGLNLLSQENQELHFREIMQPLPIRDYYI